jgi:uncharacterized protein
MSSVVLSGSASLSPRAHSRVALASIALAALVLSGCQTYTAQTAAQDTAVRTGDLSGAVAAANQRAEAEKSSKDAVIARLEQGAILRQAALARTPQPAVVGGPKATAPATGKTDATTPQNATNIAIQEPAAAPVASDRLYLRQSLAAFNLAEERIDDFEVQAKVKLGSETGAMFTNQANLPYRGQAYDKVMMNAYKALNYIQLGDRDAARVELNRALQRQRDAVAENAKRIEDAQEIARQAKDGKAKSESGKSGSYDVETAKTDPKTSASLAAVDAELNSAIKAYGDYVNPYVVFLDGLFFMANGEGNSDLERARKSIERVAAMSPENAYVKADLVTAEAAANGISPTGLTYVIFETGAAPYRDQIRFDIPTLVLTGKVSYVGAAFPKIKYHSDYIPALTVATAGQSFTSSTISSMDSVVSLDFKNEWPSILTKTLISTALKATVDAVIQKQASDQFGMWGQLAAKAITAAGQAAMNVADTRTWRSLPKEFQYVRLATPADRKLTLNAGTQTQSVDLVPGSINIVYVVSTNSTAPIIVDQFALKP